MERVRAEPEMSGQDLAREVTPREPVILEGTGPRVVALDTGIKDSIVRNLRERGATVELHPCDTSPEELLAREVTPAEPVILDPDALGPRVVALDTGIKDSIVRNLRERGVRLELHPCGTSADAIRAQEPDAVFLANGPGDPAALDYVVGTVRELVGEVPVFGICLGHQLLCRAVGLETFKLPFGHRGANHPVKDLASGRIDITSQNHGFAVRGPNGEPRIESDEPIRWETDFGAAELAQLNLYDRTVEGLVLHDVPGATVQYHPEAGPGPHDAEYLFDRFLEMVPA
jgi:carbamoyl-phosphate synthase small subunit